MKLDAIDRKILTLLQQDGRLTIRQLALHLHLTPTPVHERIKRLEREGIIEGYSVRINRKKAGKALVVFCEVNLVAHERDAIAYFEQYIGQLDEVVACHHVSGDSDYLLEIWATDMDTYRGFLRNKLSSAPNVGKVKSLFAMSEIKRSAVINF
ncbi:MAG TPA: Lrp/AsnC family transcriptional regulator [Luteibaculaceae bacterium]|jgi:Lrp/AsnC family transcriptional regulator, leucine-responsive regulatory protein|nr:Lrp/AsnC family transcriptional regulator [Luteibaculaceae bacterium]